MATKLQLDWLKSMAPAAQMAARTYGVPASITLAQCITESSWGQSQLARRCRNFFGIKAMPEQQYAEFPTREVVQGRSLVEMARFAVYPSAIESFNAHGRFLAALDRYRPAMAHADDPATFATELQACGYSTNPDYAKELMELVHEYRLTDYDAPADTTSLSQPPATQQDVRGEDPRMVGSAVNVS